jgi:hypothetical protein
MKRVIIHWTAGTNQPNGTDYLHYHYLINGDGLVTLGKFKPEDNENCYDGKYAQHTGGGNTGSIGVSMCGMYGFKSSKDIGKYPLTKKQCESTFKKVAEICKQYKIPVTAQTVMTHYEFGKSHPNTSSAGKIDIIYLPPYPEQTADKVGDFIRSKIRWYYQQT